MGAPADDAREATLTLGAWAAGLRWSKVEEPVRARLRLVLLDSLGVTALGARQPEQVALVQSWRPAGGPAPLVGAGHHTAVEAAAWLNATAMVALELDEGNKHAAGHPAAHGFPAVLALAADLGSSGPDTAAALLVAYEVAARFGRATRLREGAHPHGSWGVPGAAAGCARLLGLSPAALAAAIDTGAGLGVAGHFSSALDGNPVRDAWMGASNVSGLASARLAASGSARCTGTAATSLGNLLGTFDACELTAGLGARWDVTRGYFKRHAACSFTHPVADALLSTRDTIDLDDVRSVLVETHSLAAGLDRRSWDTRLAAMFSIPFVAATALVHGYVEPRSSDPVGLSDARVGALAQVVSVRRAPDLDARLPGERAARVTVICGDGTSRTVEVPNPVGDANHHPFDEAAVIALLAGWLHDPAAVDAIARVATDLEGASNVTGLLQGLALGQPTRTEEAP